MHATAHCGQVVCLGVKVLWSCCCAAGAGGGVAVGTGSRHCCVCFPAALRLQCRREERANFALLSPALDGTPQRHRRMGEAHGLWRYPGLTQRYFRALDGTPQRHRRIREAHGLWCYPGLTQRYFRLRTTLALCTPVLNPRSEWDKIMTR